MSKISVVLVAYNEGLKIKNCLESVKFADEIIFVDVGSSDNTVEIAKKYTKNIFNHKNYGFVEPARNFAISKAKGDYVLVVDADEEIPEKLARKLSEVAGEGLYDYVLLPRKNIIFNKWIKSDMWWPDYNVRFFKKGKVEWTDEIHSKPKLSGTELRIDPDEELSIKHNNYQSISQYIQKLDRYTTAEAEKIDLNEFSWVDAIRFPFNDFVKTFFLQKGYRDGLHGLVLSLFQAFYMETVFAKIWEKRKFEEVRDPNFFKIISQEFQDSGDKFKYWHITGQINESGNVFKKMTLRIIRKILSSNIKTP